MTRSSPSADPVSRSRIRHIIGFAAIVYLVCLAVAWQFGRVWIDRRSEKLLREARVRFAARLEELIHATQWYQAHLVFDALGGRTNAVPHSVAEMRAIAERFEIDELNVVSSNGIVIASNLAKVVGDDWRKNPSTAAMLEILAPNSPAWRMAQPFRHGTVNPEFYCTYFSEVFNDRSGLLELGYTMERLAYVLGFSNAEAIGLWTIGRRGRFSVVDADRDHVPDLTSTWPGGRMPDAGVLERVLLKGERVTRLTFDFAGRLFVAIVPEQEFGDQCVRVFAAFALTSAILILLFSVVLMRLAHAGHRVAALRREADARAAADLAVARTIQLSSLPRAESFAPACLAFSLAAEMQPAREVGGDFYDFFWVDVKTLALVIADVSGKGVPAALFMHEAKHAFPEALRRESGLTAAVRAMNDALCERNEAEMFVTAWFGLLDVTTGALEFVNAGHNPPFLIASEGAVERLDARGGRFLGVFPQATYRAVRRVLRPGERLILYTDGVTEAMNAARRPFGEDRLCALLATNPASPLSAIRAAVAAHVDGAEQSDDLTLLVLTWRGVVPAVERVFPVTEEVCAQVLSFLRETVSIAEVRQKSRLLNAADELVANVVLYSRAQTLRVSVAMGGSRCVVTLADDGIEYNPLAHRDPAIHQPLADRAVGGLGILISKRLVSFLHWSRRDGFNCVTLVQHVHSQPQRNTEHSRGNLA